MREISVYAERVENLHLSGGLRTGTYGFLLAVAKCSQAKKSQPVIFCVPFCSHKKEHLLNGEKLVLFEDALITRAAAAGKRSTM